jgi:4-hydroxybenzoate decarboxylase
MYVSDTELRISIGPRHDLGRIHRQAEARGEAVEAAFLVGVAPALFMAACTSIPPDADEVALAAAIAGAPFPARPAATIDLLLPDAADIVIEGRILPNERRPEAPFGEWMGYTVPERQSHVFQVQRTLARPDALMHGLVCGSNEDLRPLEAATAARIYKALAAQFDCVLDVVCFPGMLVTAVKIRQNYEGQARQVLMAAITAHFLYSKVCIVVDEDVDIYRLDDVLWAYATRARPDERTQVLGHLPGFFRDPHKDHWGRLGLDATMPWGRFDEFRRKQVPGRDRIDLQALLAVPAAPAS